MSSKRKILSDTLTRNCPKCSKFIIYKSRHNCRYAERDGKLCANCQNFKGVVYTYVYPCCDKVTTYTHKSNYECAVRTKRRCLKHSNCGTENHFFGKKHSNKTIEKLRKLNLGRKHTEETKLKCSIASAKAKRHKLYSEESRYSMKRQKSHFYTWMITGKNGFEKYIGLSRNEFKLWISRNFTNNMSWDNWSRTTWHIDHKKPLSSYELTKEEEVFKAWNFSNLQPLDSKLNISKGAKMLS